MTTCKLIYIHKCFEGTCALFFGLLQDKWRWRHRVSPESLVRLYQSKRPRTPEEGACLSAPLWEPQISLSNGEIWKISIIFPNYCHRDTRLNGGQPILYELPEVCLMSAHPKWPFVSEMLSSQIDRRDVAKLAIHLSRRSCRRQGRVTCPPPTAIRSGHLKLRSILCSTEFQLLTHSLRVKLLELIKYRHWTRGFFWLWNKSYQNPERSWRGVLCTLWRHVMPCL
jgi:hypothetical protein